VDVNCDIDHDQGKQGYEKKPEGKTRSDAAEFKIFSHTFSGWFKNSFLLSAGVPGLPG